MAKILLIDDDAWVRGTIARILRRKGYDVLVAENGEEGVSAFHTDAPDLVITDIIMPDKEGIETIREIRRVSAAVKIIAISGGARLGNYDVLDIAAKLGASQVFAKPFDCATLLGAIAECLDTDAQPA